MCTWHCCWSLSRPIFNGPSGSSFGPANWDNMCLELQIRRVDRFIIIYSCGSCCLDRLCCWFSYGPLPPAKDKSSCAPLALTLMAPLSSLLPWSGKVWKLYVTSRQAGQFHNQAEVVQNLHGIHVAGCILWEVAFHELNVSMAALAVCAVAFMIDRWPLCSLLLDDIVENSCA